MIGRHNVLEAKVGMELRKRKVPDQIVDSLVAGFDSDREGLFIWTILADKDEIYATKHRLHSSSLAYAQIAVVVIAEMEKDG
jgi:hypothetical protein